MAALKLKQASESPGKHFKRDCWAPSPEYLIAQMGHDNLISTKFLNDADVFGLGTTLVYKDTSQFFFSLPLIILTSLSCSQDLSFKFIHPSSFMISKSCTSLPLSFFLPCACAKRPF